MPNIIKIAITGAPCCGKTTIINSIIDKLDLNNRDVVLCPEVATMLINDGVSREDMLSFETKVALKQIELENELEEKAERDTVIICDRGLTDCFSYADDLAKNIGVDYISSWNRYDAVIMLEMADKRHYVSNDVRTEAYEENLSMQQKLLDVYIGHPHFRFVKSCERFDDKINATAKEINSILSGVETEIKYLIEYPDVAKAMTLPCKKTEIAQTYLLSTIGTHRIRERKVDGIATYFETLKIRISGISAHENEGIISKEVYDELMLNADPNKNTIFKDRYCFLYDGQYFEMDVYPFWDDKAVIELELTDQNQKVNLPDFIKVIKDVSNNKKYKNNYLASLKL